jgi:hypothetical protein
MANNNNNKNLILNERRSDEFKEIQENAYKNDLYPHQSKYDLLGNDGTWQKGDWLIHWPGTGLDLRLQLARHFMNEVVK